MRGKGLTRVGTVCDNRASTQHAYHAHIVSTVRPSVGEACCVDNNMVLVPLRAFMRVREAI